MKKRVFLYYIVVSILFCLFFNIVEKFNLPWISYSLFILIGMLFDYIWDGFVIKKIKP